MALSTRALRIFSAVEVLRGGQSDIRFALAPLFQADLSKFNGELFDPRKLSDEINNQYRLNINRDVVEELIPVFLELKWLSRVEIPEHAYIVTCPVVPEVGQHRDEFEDKARKLSADFRLFIENLSPLSQVNLDDEGLIDSLVDWLISLDVLSETDLRQVSQVGKIGNKLVFNVAEPDQVRADDMSYLCARYAQSIVKARSELAPFLIELAAVGLITEVVRDFHKPSSSVAKTDITLYLDAPVALDLLGLSGTDAKETIKTILDKVVTLGGAVRIYRLSVEEMQTSLNALLSRRPQDREGPTADALRRNEVLEAFVRQVAGQPDPFLEEAGVKVLDQSLDQYPGDHKFFEQKAVDELYSQIGWVREDVPRFHDAAIAALTIRRRRGARSADLFDVKHLVITRNPFYPNLARRISAAHHYINQKQVGPVIHQRQLATAVWLRAGLGKDDETIPRRYILSSCRRVLSLRKNIVDRVRQVSDTLTPEQAEQLELLLTQSRSAQVLMDKTLGAENVIDSSNIALLVDEMRKGLVDDVRTEADEKIRKMRQQTRLDKQELERELSSKVQDLDTLQERLNERTMDLERIEADSIRALLRRVNRVTRRRQVTVTLGLLVLVMIVEALGFFGSDFKGKGAVAALLIILVLSVGLFLKEMILPGLVSPWFRRMDEELLWREAIDAGLDPERVEQSTSYEGGKFKLLNN